MKLHFRKTKHAGRRWRVQCLETRNRTLGPVSQKSRKLFGLEKPFVKLRPAYSVKQVFSYVVKRIKSKITARLEARNFAVILITARFRASRHLRFGDTKKIFTWNSPSKVSGRSRNGLQDGHISRGRVLWQERLFRVSKNVSLFRWLIQVSGLMEDFINMKIWYQTSVRITFRSLP